MKHVTYHNLKQYFTTNREQVLSTHGGAAKLAAIDKAIETIDAEFEVTDNIKSSSAAVAMKEWLLEIYYSMTN